MKEIKLYENGLSLTQISGILKIPRSTVRLRLIRNGVKLRTSSNAIKLAASQGRMGTSHKGKRNPLTEEWKQNIRKSALKRGEVKALGYTLKPSGYYEITRGENKGRLLHRVIYENHLGRKLKPNEVIHHINETKTDNRISNLIMMKPNEHAKYHASKREMIRNNKGQFKS